MYRSRWLLFAMLGGLGILITLFIYSCSSLLSPMAVQPLVVHPPASAIAGFVTSSTNSVSFLQWKQEAHGVLSGMYSIDYARESHHQETISGSIQGATIKFSTSFGVLSGTLQKQILQIQSTSTGKSIWYAVSSSDYQHIVADFHRYIQVGKQRTQLLAILQSPPDDSNPAYFDTRLHTAGKYVADEQTMLQQFQLTDTAHQCALVQAFQSSYPVARDPAQMPFTRAQDTSFQSIVDRSSLARAVSTLQNDWDMARAITLPKLPASSFPWLIDPGTDIEHGKLNLEDLQTIVLKDGNAFRLLEKQHQYIQQQIQQKASTCPIAQAQTQL